MKTAPIEKRASVPVTPSEGAGPVKNQDASPKHWKNWPNETAYNAPGDSREKTEVPITGKLPSYVAGVLYRTGPGSYKVSTPKAKNGEFAVSHWFDGFTTVHRFELVPGGDGIARAYYSSYGQVDKQINRIAQTGKLEDITFGQKRDPCDTLYRKFKSVFSPTGSDDPHSSNIGVAIRATLPTETAIIKGHDNRPTLTLTTDNNATKQFDAATLEPLGVVRQTALHPSLKGPMSAAHPAHDPETGDIYNYNLDFGPTATYRIFRACAKTGKVDIIATIADRSLPAAYLHSMFITQNFLILCVWPAYFSGYGLPVLWHRNVMDAIAFSPKAKTTWLVIDRRHGRGVVKKFSSPAMFAFHTINAWEETRTDEAGTVDVVCELGEFANTDILHKLFYENMLSNSPGAAKFDVSSDNTDRIRFGLARYRLPSVPMNGQKTSPGIAENILRIPAPDSGDLPRINPAYVFKQHRYVYGVLLRGKSSFIDGLGKTDTKDKTCKVWERETHTPGEPIFVADPDGENEDDGAVLTVVHDGEKGTSYLLCLDARTMEEMGRVDVARAVGVGFHGLHVPLSGA